MRNPLKFIQEVKQETFRITWPTKKDTMMGAVMVFALASVAAIFFLILDQILRFLLNLVLTISKGSLSTDIVSLYFFCSVFFVIGFSYFCLISLVI